MEPTWTNEMAMIEMGPKWGLSFLLPIMALANQALVIENALVTMKDRLYVHICLNMFTFV